MYVEPVTSRDYCFPGPAPQQTLGCLRTRLTPPVRRRGVIFSRQIQAMQSGKNEKRKLFDEENDLVPVRL